MPEMPLVVNSSVLSAGIERYYTAYERYLSVVRERSDNLGGYSEADSRVGASRTGVAPPVWFGCGLQWDDAMRGVDSIAEGVADAQAFRVTKGAQHVGTSGIEGLLVDDNVVDGEVDAVESVLEVHTAKGGVASSCGCDVSRNDYHAAPRDCGDGLASSRGPNWERNKANRDKAKRRKARIAESGASGGRRSFFSSCEDSVRVSLAETRAQRYIAENIEAIDRAKNRAKVLQGIDVESEVRKRQTKINADIERNLVSMEQTHATLAATGNVPGDMTGFAATIVGSGSISPDSSASMKEFRACQKALLDAEEKNERMAAALNNAGIPIPHGPRSQKDIDHADGLWTDNTENREYIDDRYSCYLIQEDYCDSGKIRVVPC